MSSQDGIWNKCCVALAKGDYSLVKQLIKAGYDVNYQESSTKSTVLIYCVMKGLEPGVTWLLQNCGNINLDLTSSTGNRAIDWAEHFGYSSIVQKLKQFEGQKTGSKSIFSMIQELFQKSSPDSDQVKPAQSSPQAPREQAVSILNQTSVHPSPSFLILFNEPPRTNQKSPLNQEISINPTNSEEPSSVDVELPQSKLFNQEELLGQIEELKRKLEFEKGNNTQLQMDLTAKDQECQNLKKEATGWEEQQNQLRKENADLSSKVQSLQEEMEAKNKLIEDLNTKCQNSGEQLIQND